MLGIFDVISEIISHKVPESFVQRIEAVSRREMCSESFARSAKQFECNLLVAFEKGGRRLRPEY